MAGLRLKANMIKGGGDPEKKSQFTRVIQQKKHDVQANI